MLVTWAANGAPLTMSVPKLSGFNFKGGTTMSPEFIALLLGLVLYTAAFVAEVVRAGIQSVSKGQREAAMSLGLKQSHVLNLVILPQALRIVLPALMNDVIRAFKNTTFVSIIGLFDVLGATATALEDPLWVLYALEAYVFIFVLYFVLCFSMSKYSAHVERDLSRGRNL